MQIGVRIEESWSWSKAVSMVGGTIRRKLIHRESFRASVLRLTVATTRSQNHCTELLCFDNDFVLIDGHHNFDARILVQRRRQVQTVQACGFQNDAHALRAAGQKTMQGCVS